MRILLCVFVVLVSSAVANDAYEDAWSETPEYSGICGPGPVWDGPLAELYSNGPWWNSVGTGFGGADESRMTASETTYGAGCQFVNNNKCADDFTIPAGQTWSITGVTLFNYQTNSGTSPTINAAYLTIYSGDNPTSGTVVYGDYTTNRFVSAVWTNCYRVLSTEYGTGTARPIMAVTCNVTTTLGAGNYVIGWCTGGTGASGPWQPPVVNNPPGGVTGNAWQSVAGAAWLPLLMGGTNLAYGCPFVIEGSTTAIATETWGSIKTLF